MFPERWAGDRSAPAHQRQRRRQPKPSAGQPMPRRCCAAGAQEMLRGREPPLGRANFRAALIGEPHQADQRQAGDTPWGRASAQENHRRSRRSRSGIPWAGLQEWSSQGVPELPPPWMGLPARARPLAGNCHPPAGLPRWPHRRERLDQPARNMGLGAKAAAPRTQSGDHHSAQNRSQPWVHPKPQARQQTGPQQPESQPPTQEAPASPMLRADPSVARHRSSLV